MRLCCTIPSSSHCFSALVFTSRYFLPCRRSGSNLSGASEGHPEDWNLEDSVSWPGSAGEMVLAGRNQGRGAGEEEAVGGTLHLDPSHPSGMEQSWLLRELWKGVRCLQPYSGTPNTLLEEAGQR